MVGPGTEVLIQIHGLLECFSRNLVVFNGDCKVWEVHLLDGFSNSHSKIPKSLVPFLKSSQSCSSELPIQMPMYDVVNESQKWQQVFVKFWSERRYFMAEKYIVAHTQAAGVPIAVPSNVVAHDEFHSSFYGCQRQFFWKRYEV